MSQNNSKLKYILKNSYESEKFPGWNDSLSLIIEKTLKDISLNIEKENKDSFNIDDNFSL